MKNIVALGAGRMGRGIAQVFAYAGHLVTLLDLKERSLETRQSLFKDARSEINGNLDFLSRQNVMKESQIEGIMGRIDCTGPQQAATVLAAADLVFEAVPEIIEAKREALETVSDQLPASTIIASTTSTFRVDSLAEFVHKPARFLNAHWLNPAYLVPLVEVSPGAATDEAITQSFMAFLESIGKVPVRCKASPGFIIPRLQTVAMNEAARMVEEGVASVEDIDRAVRVGFGVRYASMGMLEFIDWGGGDILYYASKYLSDALQSDRYGAADIIARNMDDGKIGMGAGEGFYDFSQMDRARYREETLGRMVSLIDHLGLLRPPK